MSRIHDLTGRRFGRLVVVSFYGIARNGGAAWKCRCDCGRDRVVRAIYMTRSVNPTISCGCRRDGHPIHGDTKGGVRSPRFKVWIEAKGRAKKKGLPFTIGVTDVVVPALCPLLGIPLKHHVGDGKGPRDDTPSLDRLVPRLGYVPGNVWVISNRANRIKADATADELALVSRNFRWALAVFNGEGSPYGSIFGISDLNAHSES